MNPTTKQITQRIKKESLSHTNFSFSQAVGLRSLASLGALCPNYSHTNREATRENRHPIFIQAFAF